MFAGSFRIISAQFYFVGLVTGRHRSGVRRLMGVELKLVKELTKNCNYTLFFLFSN